MSSLIRNVDFMESSWGPKGSRETSQEDRVLGNLAPPGYLKESTSHHGASLDDLWMILDMFCETQFFSKSRLFDPKTSPGLIVPLHAEQ